MVYVAGTFAVAFALILAFVLGRPFGVFFYLSFRIFGLGREHRASFVRNFARSARIVGIGMALVIVVGLLLRGL